MKLWVGFVWLSMRPSGGLLCGSVYGRVAGFCVAQYAAEWRAFVNTLINQRNYCLAERLLACHGQPYCMMLVLVQQS